MDRVEMMNGRTRMMALLMLMALLLAAEMVRGTRVDNRCPDGCGHGECVGHRKCRCELGYAGKMCNTSIWEEVEHICYPRGDDPDKKWQEKAEECQRKNGKLAIVRPPHPPMTKNRSPSDCPAGFIRILDTSCHYFSGEEVTWSEAQQKCQSRGGHLVTIQNEQENQALKGYISKINLMNHFIGAHNNNSAGRWKWEESDEAVNYADWKPGEPNNALQKEHCAAISAYPGDHFQWMDVNCQERNAYICESERLSWIAPAKEETHTRCPKDFLNMGGLGCYYVSYDEKVSAETASDRCREHGGHLAVIESIEETRALRLEVRKTLDSPVYVSSSGGVQTCAILAPFRETVYLNQNEACLKQLGYLCETYQRVWFSPDMEEKADVLVRCPQGYIKMGSKGCYRFSGKEKATFADARKECEDMSGHLVAIKSHEQLEALQSYIRRIGMQDYYIGLSDIKDEGYWLQEPYGQPQLMSDWYKDEPNDYRGNEDCVIMSAFADCDLQWEDVNCNGKYAFICETDQREWISKENPDIHRDCPLGFRKIEDFGCYYMNKNELATFREAASKCRDLNSYLVRVETAFENDALRFEIQKVFQTDVFMGAQITSRGQWNWADTETPVRFTDWTRGQPDDGDRSKSCIMWSVHAEKMYQWSATSCDQRINFVCETDKRIAPDT